MTFLIFISAFLTVGSFVFIGLYLREKKKVKDLWEVRENGRELNKALINNVHELNTENKRLRLIIEMQTKSK